MLVVKTKLKEFAGKGIGLVADENIKKGQVVWTFNPVIDILVKEKDVPKEAKEFFENYGVKRSGGRLFLNADNARFINHSPNPNTKSLGAEKDNVAKFGDEQFSNLFVKAMKEKSDKKRLEIFKKVAKHIQNKMGGFEIDGWKFRSSAK